MARADQEKFRLRRRSAPLPSESDFDPFGDDLDAQYAWKNFGELTLKQAYELFLTNPTLYQEDFMFMGGAAFDYYFPVIDRYIRKVAGDEEGNDCEVVILGSAVAAQFDWNGADPSDALVREIKQLADYVSLNVAQYSPAAKDQKRIKREWDRVHKKIAAHKHKSKQNGAG